MYEEDSILIDLQLLERLAPTNVTGADFFPNDFHEHRVLESDYYQEDAGDDEMSTAS